MKVITLSNGKTVANFSSPHSFTFTDGSVLPAVSNGEAERLKVDFIETPFGYKGDIELSFSLSEAVQASMKEWLELWGAGRVDVVFIPLPMLTALWEDNYPVAYSPFRAVRIEDRVLKLISIDKQCI